MRFNPWRPTAENPWDPKQPRDASGRWRESGAVSASRAAFKASQGLVGREANSIEHNHAARAHRTAAEGHKELAAKHRDLGNAHAARKFQALSEEHTESAEYHESRIKRPPSHPVDRLAHTERGPRVRKASSARIEGGYRAAETRKERDDFAEQNISPDFLPLWNRTKGSYRGTPHERFERFTAYAEAHPHEVAEAWQDESEKKLGELVDSYETTYEAREARANPGMSSVNLSSIIEPHEVSESVKLDRLVKAYENNDDVTPVVVVRLGGALLALSGSHRIAAMRRAYPKFTDLDWEVIVVDGEALWAEAEEKGDSETIDVLQDLKDGKTGDFTRAIEALLPYFSGDAQAALRDQIENPGARPMPTRRSNPECDNTPPAPREIETLSRELAAAHRKYADWLMSAESRDATPEEVARAYAPLRAAAIRSGDAREKMWALEGIGAPAPVVEEVVALEVMNPGRRRNPPPSYREAHWGIGAKRSDVFDVGNPKENKSLIALGELVAVTYGTIKGGDGNRITDYVHTFERKRPMLCYGSKDGLLYVAGGDYTVEKRGIVG